MLITLLPLLLAAAHAAAPAPARPDIIPEGYDYVPVQQTLDLDALRERCSLQYVVQKGDSLWSIAKAQLGASARAAEIPALNPDVEPRALQIGQRIWLPARDAKAPLRFVYLNSFPSFGQSRPYAIGERIQARYGSFALVIVGADHRDDVAKARDWKKVTALDKAGKLQIVNGSSVSGLVESDSSVKRIEEKLKVVRNDKGRYSIEHDVRYLDGKGRPVKQDQQRARKASDKLWLGVFALGGAALIWRRRRSSPAAGELATA